VRQGYVECSQQVEPARCRQQVAPPPLAGERVTRDSRLLAVVTSRFSSLLMIVLLVHWRIAVAFVIFCVALDTPHHKKTPDSRRSRGLNVTR